MSDHDTAWHWADCTTFQRGLLLFGAILFFATFFHPPHAVMWGTIVVWMVLMHVSFSREQGILKRLVKATATLALMLGIVIGIVMFGDRIPLTFLLLVMVGGLAILAWPTIRQRLDNRAMGRLVRHLERRLTSAPRG